MCESPPKVHGGDAPSYLTVEHLRVECTDKKGKKALRLFYTGYSRKGSRGKMKELFPASRWCCKNVDVLGVVAVDQHADWIKKLTIAEMQDEDFISQVSAWCSKCKHHPAVAPISHHHDFSFAPLGRERHQVLTLDEGHDRDEVLKKVFIPIAEKWRRFCETCL